MRLRIPRMLSPSGNELTAAPPHGGRRSSLPVIQPDLSEDWHKGSLWETAFFDGCYQCHHLVAKSKLLEETLAHVQGALGRKNDRNLVRRL